MTDIDFNREQAVAQIKMEEAQRTHDREAELHRTNLEVASKSAEVAVKTGVLVNGGAAVAVLAFIGGMLGKDIVSVKTSSRRLKQLNMVCCWRCRWSWCVGADIFNELLRSRAR